MMKKLLIGMALLMVQYGIAQTAVNFTCNDCYGVNHDLFTAIDSGKVVVICWVEPCGGCADASLVSATLVETYNEVYPGKVAMFLVDDFANTSCLELISWANMFGIHPTTFFSDAVISMLDYGEPGMPKVVVVADADHHVFFIGNNIIDYSALEAGISNAIEATFTGFSELIGGDFNVRIFPNPCKEKVTISLNLKDRATIQTVITDQAGRIIELKVWNDLPEGSNLLELNIPSLEEGLYFLKLSDVNQTIVEKLIIVN